MLNRKKTSLSLVPKTTSVKPDYLKEQLSKVFKFSTTKKIAENKRLDLSYPLFQIDNPVKQNGAKMFKYTSNAEAFHLYKTFPYIYETFASPKRPIKFPFDFDIKEKKDSKRHYNQLMNLFFQYWKEIGISEKDISFSDLLVSKVNDNGSNQKTSLHILINGYHFEDIYVCQKIANGFYQYLIDQYCSDFENKTGLYYKYVQDNFDRLSKIVKDVKKGENIYLIPSNFNDLPVSKQAEIYIKDILGFDKCIYGDRAFRCLGSAKYGKSYDHKLYPVHPVTWEKLSGHEGGLKWLTYDLWRNYLATYIPEDSILLEYKNEYVMKTDVKKSKQKTKLKTNGNVTQSVGGANSFTNSSFQQLEDLVLFVAPHHSGNRDDWVKVGYILQNYLLSSEERDDSEKYIKLKQNIFKLFCRFSRSSKEYENTPDEELRTDFDSFIVNRSENDAGIGTLLYWAKNIVLQGVNRFNFKQGERINQHFKNERYIQLPFITQREDGSYKVELFKNGILVIQSPTGTAKTTQTAIMCEGKKAIAICHRRTLVAQLCNTMKKKKIEVSHYSFDDEQTFANSQMKIIQIDSLLKTEKKDIQNLEKDDYICVIDETSEALKYSLTSDTFKEISLDVLRRFTELVRNSYCIICLDADISQKELDLLDNITDRKRQIEIYSNTISPWKGFPVNFHHEVGKDFLKKSPFIQKMITSHQEEPDVPIVIASDSKTVIDLLRKFIYDQYPDYIRSKKVLAYTSEIGNDKDILNDVNEKWGKASFILYSPTITTGVDFTIPAKVFTIYTGGSITPRASLQQSDRVRNKLSYDFLYLENGVKFGIRKGQIPFTYSFPKFEKQFREGPDFFMKYMNVSKDSLSKEERFKDFVPYVQYFEDYHCQIAYEKQLVMKYSMDYIINLLKRQKYNVNFNPCVDQYYLTRKLADLNIDSGIEIKNMRTECALHGDNAFDPFLHELYDGLYDYIIEKEIIINENTLVDFSDENRNGDFIEYFQYSNQGLYEIDDIKKGLKTLSKMAKHDKKERGENVLMWKGFHNPFGMLNFMSHCHKIYESMKKRCEFLDKDIQKVAQNDDFVWQLISDDKQFQGHLRFRISLCNTDTIDKKIKKDLFRQRIQYVYRNNYAKIKAIKDLEGFAGIKDRTKIDLDYISDKIKNNTILEADRVINNKYIMNVLDIFESKSKIFRMIFAEKPNVEWLEFYRLIQSLWLSFFDKMVFTNKKNLYFSSKRYKLTWSTFQHDIIQKHMNLLVSNSKSDNEDFEISCSSCFEKFDSHNKLFNHKCEYRTLYCQYCPESYIANEEHFCGLQPVMCKKCGINVKRRDYDRHICQDRKVNKIFLV